MIKKSKDPVDIQALSKKHRTSVLRLVKAWKEGRSDVEIACETGIDLTTIRQVKSDIELAHRRLRLEKKKKAFAQSQASLQRQIFLTPLL